MAKNETAADMSAPVGKPTSQRLTWSSLPVSRAGLGLSRIGSVASPITASEAERLIQTACDLGINFFDTADVYGQGDSERLLGSAVKSKRTQVVICTKAGYVVSTKARLASYVKPVLSPILRLVRKSPRGGTAARSLTFGAAMAQNFSPDHVRRSIDASLRRLRTDYIDLFMLHSPPTRGLGLDAISEALQAAMRAGKIRAIGVSSRSPDDVAVWAKWPGVDAIQVGLSADSASARQPLRDSTGRAISVIARQVLSSSGDGLDHGKAPADALRSALRVADVVLFGTTNLSHLRGNVAALANV